MRLLAITTILLIKCCEAKKLSTFEKDVTLTQSESEKLKQFKDLMTDLPHPYMKQESYLIKFLRPKDYNLEKAQEFLLENLKWREENQMDTIHSEDWSDMFHLFRRDVGSAHDREGQPVLYFDVGGLDLRSAVLSGRDSRFLRYIDKSIDEACDVVRERGEIYGNITRGHLIANAKGYNLVQHGCLRCIPVLLRIITSFERHWPECADKVMFFNVPSSAAALIEVALPLVSRETREALVIMGSNSGKNLAFLREFFEDDQISSQLGGGRVYFDEEDYN